MKYENLSKKEFEQKYGNIVKSSIRLDPSITSYEQETSIIMNDEEEESLVSSSQKSIMKYFLFDNPSFKLDEDGLVVRDKKIVAINGRINKGCIKFSKTPRRDFTRL